MGACGGDGSDSNPRGDGTPRGEESPPSKPPGCLQRGPFVQHLQPGKHAWCRCTRSNSYPLCDGTHRGTDVTPLKIVVDQPRTVAWCACGRTQAAPFCDGSHARSADS